MFITGFSQCSICSFGGISSLSGRCCKNIGVGGYNIQYLFQRAHFMKNLTFYKDLFESGSANV